MTSVFFTSCFVGRLRGFSYSKTSGPKTLCCHPWQGARRWFAGVHPLRICGGLDRFCRFFLYHRRLGFPPTRSQLLRSWFDIGVCDVQPAFCVARHPTHRSEGLGSAVGRTVCVKD